VGAEGLHHKTAAAQRVILKQVGEMTLEGRLAAKALVSWGKLFLHPSVFHRTALNSRLGRLVSRVLLSRSTGFKFGVGTKVCGSVETRAP
jgi:hypothetical protein